MNNRHPRNENEPSFTQSAARQLLMLAAGAVVALVALMWLLQALASLVGSSTTAANAVDVQNNSITIAISTEPPQLNSTLATDASSGMILGHVMEGLLRMSMDDQLEPGIAERWEVTETQAKFWLRDNAKWSDGVAVTAHDFIFAWKTALKPETASEYAFLLYPIKNARAVNEGTIGLDQLGVYAPDDLTLIIDLERPVAFFDKMVTFQTYFPLREDFYLQTAGRYGADAQEMLYTGPFVITSWVHGASLLLERNPHYWDQAQINLSTINVGYITADATARLNFFKDQRIAETVLLAENLQEALKQRWHIRREQDGTLFFLEFNHRPSRSTRNYHLRRAIQLVVDMEELVYKVTKLPGYVPGESLFPAWLPGVEGKFREEFPAPKLQLNHQQALEHLALAKQELGLQDIPPLALLAGDSAVADIQSEWLQAVLKTKLGLEIKIDKQIFKQRLAKMTSGDFDMVLAGWGPDYDDPLTFGDLFASWNLNNRGRYNNPDMDQLVSVAQNSVDAATRMQAFSDIQQLAFDDIVLLPMYERGVTYVIHPKLKNVKRRVIGADVDFTRAYIDPEGV